MAERLELDRGRPPVSDDPPLSSGGDPDRVRPGLFEAYAAIASLMPTEGRDYTVDVRYENGSARLYMTPLTKFGAEFCRHVAGSLSGGGSPGRTDTTETLQE